MATSSLWTTYRATKAKGRATWSTLWEQVCFISRPTVPTSIEITFAKLKALPRKAAERTVHGLWDAIGRLIDTFTPQECADDFAAGGYDAI